MIIEYIYISNYIKVCQFTPLRHHIFIPKKTSFLVQDFPAQKAFISWRSAGRRGRMAKAGKAVGERVFQLHLWFRALENDESSKISKECSKKNGVAVYVCFCQSVKVVSFSFFRDLLLQLDCFPLFSIIFHWFSMCFPCVFEVTPTWRCDGCSKTSPTSAFCAATSRSRRPWPNSKWPRRTGSTTSSNGHNNRLKKSDPTPGVDGKSWHGFLGFWFLGFDGIGWDSNFWDFHFPTSFGLTFGLNLLNQIDTDWHIFLNFSNRYFRQIGGFSEFLPPSGSLRDVRAGGGERSFGVRRFFSGQMRHEKSLGGRLY